MDETPVNVQSGTKPGSSYVHVATNGSLTHYHLGSRSLESAKAGGILGPFNGVAVTDSYAAYFSDQSGIDAHQLCVAHLIRELKLVDEDYRPSDASAHPQPWALQLATLLSGAVKERPDPETVCGEYRRVTGEGLMVGPPTKDSYRRERDMYNLASRLKLHEGSVLGFLAGGAREIGLPPTNNCSEQAVRPHKVRQRRSGCFRSRDAAEQYLVVQSFLRSAASTGVVGPLEAIGLALAGNPWLPSAL
jgi:transposase